MQREINATLTKEEAEIIMKIPKDNYLNVPIEMRPKILVFLIKNYLLHHKEVKIDAMGQAINSACTATKILSDEKYLNIDKIETDLVEEPKYGPKISFLVSKANPK